MNKCFILVFVLLGTVNLRAENFTANLSYGHYLKMETPQIAFIYNKTDKKSFDLRLGYIENTESNEKEEQYNISLGYKELTGETFYIAVDLSYHYFNERQNNPEFINQIFDPEEDYHGLALMFRIGNEWKFGNNFKVGADWVGLGHSFVLSDRKEDASSSRLVGVLLNLNLSYLF